MVELWKSFPPKVRNQVRKAKKSRLTAAMGRDFLPQFYDVFSRNMRDLGTPTLPFGFFENILDQFPSDSDILVVKLGEEIIAGMLLLFFREAASDPFASSKKEYLSLCPNNLLYWEALRYSCEQGYKYFDMGRSQKDSGTFRFKKQWGTETKELFYQYYLYKASHVPAIESNRSRYSLMTRGWKRLPIGLANLLGPVMRRRIPFG
jgi:FemAB-related protein (PEP-CTERM system-associated)